METKLIETTTIFEAGPQMLAEEFGLKIQHFYSLPENLDMYNKMRFRVALMMSTLKPGQAIICWSPIEGYKADGLTFAAEHLRLMHAKGVVDFHTYIMIWKKPQL